MSLNTEQYISYINYNFEPMNEYKQEIDPAVYCHAIGILIIFLFIY